MGNQYITGHSIDLQDGKSLLKYSGKASPSSNDFIYPYQQETLCFENLGSQTINFIVGGISYAVGVGEIKNVLAYTNKFTAITAQYEQSFRVDAWGSKTESSKVGRHFGYNIQSGLANYKSALANFASKRVNVSFFGDSLTNGNNSTVVYTKSFPALLRTALQTKYGDAGYGWAPCFQDQYSFASATGGWAFVPYNGGFSNYSVKTASGTVTDVANGTVRGEVVEVWYRKISGGGTAQVKVDSVTKGSIDCSGGTGTTVKTGSVSEYVNKLTITGLTSAQHTVSITPDGNGVVEFFGLYCYNASDSGILVSRAGAQGSMASDWNSPYITAQWDQFAAPNLVVLGFGANEGHNANKTYSFISTKVADHKTNLAALIAYWKNRGSDVLLLPWFRPADGWTNYWPEIVKAQYELADTYNCGLVDLYQAFGMSYELNSTIFQNLGGTPDQVHPVDSGYLQVARILESHLIL